MIIIPAIDLKDGRCVRLAQGDFSRITIYSDDPIGIARKWQEDGAERIHVIDLDGSRSGFPRNMEVIRDIVAKTGLPIEVGGGIRDMNTIETYMGMGVNWVILGTMALRDRDFVGKACRAYEGKIILGIDVKEGKVSVQGWTEQTSESAVDVAKAYRDYGLAAIIYTDIKRDGMETGVNMDATRELAQSVDMPVIASGGVSSMEDIRRLKEIEKFGMIGVIIGRALYSGAVYLKEAISLSKL